MMRIIRYLLVVTFLVVAIYGCSPVQENEDVLFQVSTMNAIFRADYDGEITYGKLKQHGDFGIGTFDALDGELFALEGKFYRIKADGKAYPVDDSMKTPFAVITFFQPDKSVLLDEASDYKQLRKYLDSLLPAKDIFYAIKIEGTFEHVKARNIPGQNRPYPQFSEVVKNQIIFEFDDVQGTMVGFWCPAYLEEINVPGYHFHFITKDKRMGGHLLDCQTENVKIEIDYTPEFHMALSESG
ncbi:acetolactate decarboxylase [bacterium]|nr:acetolactate decarboxylase [bacterium]NIN91864.1 acetolactate decarboxylase [bacterium]NIO18138.1 acetolactate decarboxylase [bacterium]NIO73110.1 acetolactate decarboxylase [bacterium]